MNTLVRLIRHAAHDGLGRRLTGRDPGARLSREGRLQAEALGQFLAASPLDAIRSSPQARTRETAECIAAARNAVVEVCKDLDEIDFGRWAGQSFEDLERDLAWRTWNSDRGRASTPGGETMRDVAARMVRRIEALRSEFSGGTVAAVSHCDAIKAAACHYLGLPFERMDRFEISPASVTTLVVGDWGGKLLALNEVAGAGTAEGRA